MDHMIYGKFGHGKTWKDCCYRIGAVPTEFFEEWSFRYFTNKIALKERAEQSVSLSIGKKIAHPSFGIGMITAVTGDSINLRFTVDFQNVGSKVLGVAWVDKNCMIID